MLFIDVNAEKTHQNLLSGVEHFQKSTLKHAETQEKIILPDPAGRVCYNIKSMLLHN